MNKAKNEQVPKSRANISRREFGRRASMVAAFSLAAPMVPYGPAPHGTHAADAQTTEEKPELSPAQLQDVEAKLANIVRKFGDRLTQEQRGHLRKILVFNERMLASVRAFPLQNGDPPASVLRISPLEEISASKVSLRNLGNREFSEGKD
jgi:hypothetical protein